MMGEKNFEDCLKECIHTVEDDKHLLLGNGFSIGLHNEFQYENIFEKCSNQNDSWKKLSDHLKTTDFEEIINAIITTKNTLSTLEKESSVNLDEIICEIKKSFLYAIEQIHPKTYTEIPFQSATGFLGHFKQNIFTTNYDILAYWALLELHDTGQRNLNDGFRNGSWTKDQEQNFFYLHGALHLYHDENGELLKACYDKNNGTIINQLKNNLDASKSPMIIFEGSSKLKQEAIKRSIYLNYTLEKLTTISGALFIHGVSFKENDKHIYDAIESNKNIKRIFISLHNKQDKEKEYFDNTVKHFLKTKQIDYYTVNP